MTTEQTQSTEEDCEMRLKVLDKSFFFVTGGLAVCSDLSSLSCTVKHKMLMKFNERISMHYGKGRWKSTHDCDSTE